MTGEVGVGAIGAGDLSLSLSLSPYPSFSLSLMDSKKNRPQSLLQIGEDQGPINIVNLAVCEDVDEIIGASVGHAR